MSSIIDVAKLANVSTATVSRVLNSPDVVSEKAKEAVRAAIKQLNYKPNDMARSLQRGNSNLIGLLAPTIINIFTAETVSILSDLFQEYGYNIFLAITNHSLEKERALINLMHEKKVCGIIILGTRKSSDENNKFLDDTALSIPTIIVDYTNCKNLYSIHMNEELGIAKAVRYLYDIGHRKIGFINGTVSLISHYYKNIGYHNEMNRLHLEQYANTHSIEISPDYAGGNRGAEILLNCSDIPTAIVTGGDTIATGVYYSIMSRGLKIPDDISVIGFSGSNSSRFTYPPMTTVNQNPNMLSNLVFNTMIDILHNNPNVNKSIVISPDLLIRDSCRAIQ